MIQGERHLFNAGISRRDFILRLLKGYFGLTFGALLTGCHLGERQSAETFIAKAQDYSIDLASVIKAGIPGTWHFGKGNKGKTDTSQAESRRAASGRRTYQYTPPRSPGGCRSFQKSWGRLSNRCGGTGTLPGYTSRPGRIEND